MKEVRRIPVNNGMYRAIYIDKRGIYHCILEDKLGNREKDNFWNFTINKSNLKALYDCYYSHSIPSDFWSNYRVYENPLENAPECDVITLLNWYRYNTN